MSNCYSDDDEFPVHDFEVKQLFEAFSVLGITLPENCLCLDVGGGRGQHAALLASGGRKIYVIDIYKYHELADGAFAHNIKKLHEKYERKFDLSKIIFLEMDSQSMLFRNSIFNFVYSINTFEHITNPYLALDEIMRVLKPGGTVYIQFDPTWTSPFGHHVPLNLLQEPWAHLVHSQEELELMIKNSGGTDAELAILASSTNRLRLSSYFNLFNSLVHRFKFEKHQFSWWPTELPNEPLYTHVNYAKALQKGYSPSELFVRGFRFVGKLAV